MAKQWPETWRVHLAPDYPVDLPLMDIGNGFHIYSFDMTGECEWNRVAARELLKKLEPYQFDGFVTVQTKSCGLTQAISVDYPRYLEVRKSRKAFMLDPKGIEVQSITTHGKQELWIGRERIAVWLSFPPPELNPRLELGDAGASRGDYIYIPSKSPFEKGRLRGPEFWQRRVIKRKTAANATVSLFQS
ncbi:MAG: hypothetical protein IIX31_03150 [Alistipes sp.]|nr:hypothetical protein [Alistipes sp.]